MGLGALIAAYQEDDEGGLRALLPLAGQTLVEYQVRCAAAADAFGKLVADLRLAADIGLASQPAAQGATARMEAIR